LTLVSICLQSLYSVFRQSPINQNLVNSASNFATDHHP
jgi:hypothetical protein